VKVDFGLVRQATPSSPDPEGEHFDRCMSIGPSRI
jgi:hypothetical protein